MRRRTTRPRRGGRAVECTGLENQHRLVAYPGFESLPLRQISTTRLYQNCGWFCSAGYRMFVRVLRVDTGLHFTVVDILCPEPDNKDTEQELDLILDLGVIQVGHLNSEQAWYIIAENLIASELAETEKQFLAKDIANWLPLLSRESLLKAKSEDQRQLAALYSDDAMQSPAIPVELAESDPLTIIADWLDSN